MPSKVENRKGCAQFRVHARTHAQFQGLVISVCRPHVVCVRVFRSEKLLGGQHSIDVKHTLQKLEVLHTNGLRIKHTNTLPARNHCTGANACSSNLLRYQQSTSTHPTHPPRANDSNTKANGPKKYDTNALTKN
jgi:hypothetical protein